ncbi:hypothetical protein KXD40_007798 [Peronospora effusa]|uniref:Condensin complex subunit 1 C-terminal domain-containing protein n=1 Tax=Peronospora effusa TaxID=542832 RepID=A0A3M6VSE5_9STRA|nr:hypothetical protein DD238_001862 [Peronospora effusa]RQM11306.1 hypothetical protein DD237_000774 [Peronospora effusa]UIZ23502.1 hypothetical protein KXD40_007798 [Peronospora effusa]
MGCIRVDRMTEYLWESLRRCLKDEDPYIYSAGVMAFTITKSVLQKLSAALNECNEWGQVFVLDALS